jgi:hypothetical protein
MSPLIQLKLLFMSVWLTLSGMWHSRRDAD